MGGQKHLIKKYANRKLYDTTTSRYVTLDGISRLIRDGVDIQVVERDTGRDLTPLILSQIVTREEKHTGSNVVEGLQERRRALLGYVRRTGADPADTTGEEVERRSALEEAVDAAVERALSRFSIPSRRELEALSDQVDELRQRLARAETQVR